MNTKVKLAVLTALVSVLVSALATGMLLGREVRLVELVGLFAGGFGAGASVVGAVSLIRASRASGSLVEAPVAAPGEA